MFKQTFKNIDNVLFKDASVDAEEMKEKLTKLDDYHIQFKVSISHQHDPSNYVFREDIDE
ncbi:MAG: hypothetical protein HOF45_04725 [Candidatus Marinimicrobia bacterium]|jgi:hypothetical protein|nr:hypothetical protein [Candidatus Neomarinimicrobiota bacterium]MBT3961020.1 hypothetical protein [Candidatus Neomarinimicrobiota bacterium]MBT4635286.1 hypothetical protein [Candidatus Neomarinimicrobiota bacterium]MBT4733403.1 hypothetical protein [Candidatus Neomarinimicrobiota bacterium]MBT6112105.1 hypothetical protein [Candidatus Neomarinimicrobiota bacterium]